MACGKCLVRSTNMRLLVGLNMTNLNRLVCVVAVRGALQIPKVTLSLSLLAVPNVGPPARRAGVSAAPASRWKGANGGPTCASCESTLKWANSQCSYRTPRLASANVGAEVVLEVVLEVADRLLGCCTKAPLTCATESQHRRKSHSDLVTPSYRQTTSGP